MRFTATSLPGSYVVELDPREDERGFFARYFCEEEFGRQGLNTKWAQINDSYSQHIYTLRGLHFQCGDDAEVKLVRCISGAIWDVIVDLRDKSPTFGRWFGEELTSQNRKMMYVPKGFAHGFLSLSSETEIVYLVSNSYQPTAEKTLVWNDQEVSINWPATPLVISEKDKCAPALKDLQPLNLGI